MKNKREISNIVRQLIIDIVSGDYIKLERDNRIGRLTIDDIAKVIDSYPGKITMPPDEAFENFDIYESKNTSKQKWAIDFDLWFDNDRSDLTLSATIEGTTSGNSIISIDDLHVL